jgi:hypothetical protein
MEDNQVRELIRQWLGEGATLSEVQKRLKSECGISMTYMDLRLLVLDIGAEIKDTPQPPKPKAAPTAPQDAEEIAVDDDDGGQPEDLPPESGAGVQLSVDQIVVPGAMVSGNVVFSDGERARWLIDQTGRFGLEPSTPGYRPTDDDLRSLQIALRAELQRLGYM